MSKIVNYVKESYDELIHKVTWPTYNELQNSAVVVAIACLIIALIVFLMDFVCGINPSEGVFWKGIIGYYYSIVGG